MERCKKCVNRENQRPAVAAATVLCLSLTHRPSCPPDPSLHPASSLSHISPSYHQDEWKVRQLVPFIPSPDIWSRQIIPSLFTTDEWAFTVSERPVVWVRNCSCYGMPQRSGRDADHLLKPSTTHWFASSLSSRLVDECIIIHLLHLPGT